MKTIIKQVLLGTGLAATAAIGVLAGAAPASAHGWDGGPHGGGGGAGVAVAAGLFGLAAGAIIASSHDHYEAPPRVVYAAPPVVYAPQPVAYAAPAGCYNAYPGYDGYCYPATYYIQSGWGWHDGGWWYGGARYARPFVVGGYRGGYHGDYHVQYHDNGYHGGYRGGNGWGGGDHGRR